MRLFGKSKITRGFTLIELMVVITIIAILAGMLLPLLAKATVAGRRTVCMNNQRQLYLGWWMYTQDHDGRIPRNEGTGGVRADMPDWVGGQLFYEDHFLFPEFGSDSTNTALIIPGGFGSIGPYVGSANTYRCPADSSWVLINETRHSRVRSYSINSFLGSVVRRQGNPGRMFFREEELQHIGPDRIFIFLDEHEDSIDDGIFSGSATPMAARWFLDLPASRHGQGAVLTYASGSVRFKEWKDARTLRPGLHKSTERMELAGNKDILWLWGQMTAPVE